MADFDVVKISHLPPTEIVFKDDLMVVDRLQLSGEYVTNAVRIGKIIDYATTLDLNFTGNVTFNNTIQPLPGGSLDAIFDNVTIRQSITINDGAEINGIYLDDLEDVKIDLPQVGDVLVYQLDPLTREGIFLNRQFTASGYVFEAPVDGNYYARKDEAWHDIEDIGYTKEAPDDGKYYARKDEEWVDIEEIGYIKDAPDDGNFYARKDGQWIDITSYLQLEESYNIQYEF